MYSFVPRGESFPMVHMLQPHAVVPTLVLSANEARSFGAEAGLELRFASTEPPFQL